MNIDILEEALLRRRHRYRSGRGGNAFKTIEGFLLFILGIILIARGYLYFKADSTDKPTKVIGVVCIVIGVIAMILAIYVDNLPK